MSMVINTNLSSLTAQRHLASSRADMETAMERLSSGKRINSAGDDAAGLTIAHQMDNQVASLNQATRNANDGIAMINMAEGAMDQFSAMLTRMKELATQSANGIYSEQDRSNLNKEFIALKSEIDRIADVTVYNGVNVLNETAGAAGPIAYQVGDLGTDQISVDYKSMKTGDIGKVSAAGSETIDYTATTSLQEQINAAAGAFDNDLVSSSVVIGSSKQVDYRIVDASAAQTAVNAMAGTAIMKIEVNGVSYEQEWISGSSAAVSLDATIEAMAAKLQASGFTVSANAINIDDPANAGTTIASSFNSYLKIEAPDHAKSYQVGQLELVDRVDGGVGTKDLADMYIDGTDNSKAIAAMASVDKAIQDVDTYRSELGAKANQLEHTASNLMTRVQYTSAARSRIMDADYATESANLAKAQVLQQAGTAMLAQANASTQNVLSLLK